MFQDESIKANLVDRRLLAKDTYEITLELPEPFQFEPGQYVGLTMPDLPVSDLFAKRRDFSITSPPGAATIRLAFRASATPFKQALLADNPPNLVVRGPNGMFTIPSTIDQPLTFIAGGIGIAPFMSILLAGLPVPVNLITIDSSTDRISYDSELRNLPNLNLKRRVGRVASLAELTHQLPIDPAGLYMVSGPPSFTGSIRSLLREAGVAPLSIMLEEFTGYGTLD